MEIILIRHAQSLANDEGVYQGQTYDTDLSKTGKKQAEKLMHALGKEYPQIDAIYASPLKRSIQTADILTKGLVLGEPVTDNRIIEIDHGLWDKLTPQQIEDQYPEQYHQYKTHPEAAQMPEGETLQKVSDRAFEFLKTVVQEPYSRILVVTHDMVIRVILTKAMRRSINDIWNYELDNTGYSVLEHEKRFQVISVNNNEHLFDENLRTSSVDQAV